MKKQFGKTVVLDEIQRQPELFPLLRSLVDAQVREGVDSGHYLVLGSSSPDLLRQSSEILVGRIIYLELNPFTVDELVSNHRFNLEDHWLRGGFPRSYLAPSVVCRSADVVASAQSLDRAPGISLLQDRR